MEGDIKTTSRIAIAAIICAIAEVGSLILFCFATCVGVHEAGGDAIGACLLFSSLAFVLGIISIVVITIRRKLLKGYVYAILAIFLSSPFILAMYGAHLASVARKETEKAYTGTYNLRLLGKTLIEYAKDNEGYLPIGDQWCDLLLEHNSNLTEDNFRHPRAQRLNLGICNFAFNKNLSGLHLNDIRDDVVLVFEADGDWNLTGTGELLKNRRTRAVDELYVDVLFADQSMRIFWFHRQAYKKFDSRGRSYVWEPLCWKA